MKSERIFSLPVIITIILFLASTTAHAHKVNIFAYSEGDTIFTESYFPDGRKVQGGKVEVYDSKDSKLLEGKTDDKGVFNFKTPKKDDLKIVLIATMGHKNSFLIEADEIEAVAGGGATTTPVVSTSKQETTESESKKAVVAQQNSSEKKHRHIEPPQESHAVAILAGLGFILGLTYLILHFTKKDETKKG
jgi:nickel transport protein